MKLSELLVTLDRVIFPECCAACFEPVEASSGSALCRRCLVEWEREKSLCRSRGRSAKITEYSGERESGLYLPVIYAVGYDARDKERVANRILYKLKHNATKRLLEFVAFEYEGMLREDAPLLFDGSISGDELAIAWIPRRPESVIRDGYDHMERCAGLLSKRTGFAAQRLLVRRGGALEQKYLDSKTRLENARTSISLAPKVELSGRTVILIDDLVTTGASIEAATRLLLEAGTRLVIPVTLAATGISLN